MFDRHLRPQMHVPAAQNVLDIAEKVFVIVVLLCALRVQSHAAD
jgi:hypothetical protein